MTGAATGCVRLSRCAYLCVCLDTCICVHVEMWYLCAYLTVCNCVRLYVRGARTGSALMARGIYRTVCTQKLNSILEERIGCAYALTSRGVVDACVCDSGCAHVSLGVLYAALVRACIWPLWLCWLSPHSTATEALFTKCNTLAQG